MTPTRLDLSRSNQELQASLDRAEPRIVAAYALIGAILLFGGLGYLIDRWAGSSPWALALGLLIGVAIGFANLVASLRRQ
jgi:F0F1-type ATP synthase assembly protein I